MSLNSAILLLFVLPLAAAGCGTAPGVDGPGGAPPCDGPSTCASDPVPESVCLEHLAARRAMDGCGVFVIHPFFGGDDANPGTKDRPVRSVRRAIELARTGRGRVFLTDDAYQETVTLPSGVDIYGGFETAIGWERLRGLENPVHMMTKLVVGAPGLTALTVEPTRAGDTGAADGVSIIDHVLIKSSTHVGMVVRSGAAVEIIGSWIEATAGLRGDHGEEWPWPYQAATGPDGQYGEDACSAATVPGGARAVNPCEGGIPSFGGAGGEGLPDGAGDGEDGQPREASDPTAGRGGDGDAPGVHCQPGQVALHGDPGIPGEPGKGRGRIDETGWHPDRAGDGTRGTPGQGGGGGGGRRGGLAVCDVASKGGAGGGSGGAGGCGGRGGRGGENGQPSIGILALHAKVTVRDSTITVRDGGPGGDGGGPEDGGKGGRGLPGGAVGDGTWSCGGADGGDGGPGGRGGPGRGGDSIGVAYLDEDQLTLEAVTFELGLPGPGGTSWNWSGDEITGEDGIQVKTLRFPESQE
ncbi:hypothetical protein WME95_48190 [Sorangium sp. So ce327]|uniref:hypothetical protein n=1 Tax=Sorangium sp. So ce327 TaxID=3133301 RepID=UPI003F5D8C92